MSASREVNYGLPYRTKTISVTSGKGGVGKSTLVSNLALEFEQRGKRVLILDGDMGMANIDIMFGVRPAYSVESVLAGNRELSDIIIELSDSISLIPGGSGIYGLQKISTLQRRALMDQVNGLKKRYDVMLVDTASGIDDNVLYLNAASQEILIVLTPEPASLTDAYALIKVLNKKFSENKFSIIANMVVSESEGMQLFKRLSDVAQKFLNVSLDYKGSVPKDSDLRLATKTQQLITRKSPRSPSSIAIRQLSEKLSNYGDLMGVKGGLQFFWEQLVSEAS